MYDSYSEYYGFYDVQELKEVRLIGNPSTTGQANAVRSRGAVRRERMTTDEYAEFVIQKSAFMATLKKELARYDQVIGTLDSDEVVLVEAYRHKRQKVQDLADADIRDFDDLELCKWMYNGGSVRSKREEGEARSHLKMQRQYEEDMWYRESGDYKIQKFFFVLLSLLAIWFAPGWVVALVQGEISSDFHITATLVNLGVLFFLHPVQLLLFGLACCSDGFVRLKTRNDGSMGAKGAATIAGVSAAMQARNMARMGKSLMSGGKKRP